MLKKTVVTAIAACACALLCVMPTRAAAAPGTAQPTVVYDGAAKAWHGEHLQEQDVVAAAGSVMPGDVIVQEFDVAARNVARGTTLSVRPNADAETLAVVSDMSIEIADESGATVARGVLGELASDQAEPLALGTYASDSVTSLHIRLFVPTSVGNEAQGRERTIAWVFTAQEDGDTVSAGSSDLLAQTGDDPLSVYGPMVLGALGVLLILAAVVLRKRR